MKNFTEAIFCSFFGIVAIAFSGCFESPVTAKLQKPTVLSALTTVSHTEAFSPRKDLTMHSGTLAWFSSSNTTYALIIDKGAGNIFWYENASYKSGTMTFDEEKPTHVTRLETDDEIYGIHVFSKDSIFALSPGNIIRLFNRNGDCLDSVTMLTHQIVDAVTILMQNTNYILSYDLISDPATSIVFDGENFRATGIPTFASQTPADIRQPDHPFWRISYDVTLHDATVAFTTGVFPQKYRKDFYGSPIPWRIIGEDRSSVYVFEASDSIYQYNQDGVLTLVASMHSMYDTVPRTPYSFDLYNADAPKYVHEYEASQSFYRKPLWDKWRQQYYVLFFHPQRAVQGLDSAIYSELTRDWSLIVLDKDLAVTAEYFIPGKIYDPMMFDVIREGIVFPFRNRPLPDIANSAIATTAGCMCDLNITLFSTYDGLTYNSLPGNPQFRILSLLEEFERVR